VVSLIACGGSARPSSGKDETAAQRARREAAAAGDDDVSSQGKAWGGWRYAGDRDKCFFVVGRQCFDDLRAACKAARCDKDCRTEGGGPATIRCRK